MLGFSGVETIELRANPPRLPRRADVRMVDFGVLQRGRLDPRELPEGVNAVTLEQTPGGAYVRCQANLTALTYGARAASGSLDWPESFRAIATAAKLAGQLADCHEEAWHWDVTRLDTSGTARMDSAALGPVHGFLLGSKRHDETLSLWDSSGRTVTLRYSAGLSDSFYDKGAKAREDKQLDPGNALRLETRRRAFRKSVHALDHDGIRAIVEKDSERLTGIMREAKAMATNDYSARVDTFMAALSAAGREPKLHQAMRLAGFVQMVEEGREAQLREGMSRRTFYETRSDVLALLGALAASGMTDAFGPVEWVMARDLVNRGDAVVEDVLSS